MGASRPLKLVLAAVAAVVVLAVGGTYVYIHFVEGDPPARLALDSGATATTAAPAGPAATSGGTASLAGTWKVTTGSQAGYRVKEVLFGQSTTAVGRTSKVTGSFDLAGTTVSAAKFTVDLTSVTSDQSRRDGQFHNRIMQTSTFPTAIFTLTKPVDIGSVPAEATPITVRATGDLVLHGTTRTVTIDLQAQRTGSNVRVAGTIPVTFADYGIPNPSFGPASTDDHGDIEFLLVLAK